MRPSWRPPGPSRVPVPASRARVMELPRVLAAAAGTGSVGPTLRTETETAPSEGASKIYKASPRIGWVKTSTRTPWLCWKCFPSDILRPILQQGHLFTEENTKAKRWKILLLPVSKACDPCDLSPSERKPEIENCQVLSKQISSWTGKQQNITKTKLRQSDG